MRYIIMCLLLLTQPAFAWQIEDDRSFVGFSDGGRPMLVSCVRGRPRVAITTPIPLNPHRVYTSNYPMVWSIDNQPPVSEMWTLSNGVQEVYLIGEPARVFYNRLRTAGSITIGDSRIPQRDIYNLNGIFISNRLIDGCGQ